MVDISDVRLDGVSHEEIMRWVGEGDADRTTHVFEARMQKVVSVLYESSETTNRAVQRANAGDWQGSAAESAHGAMVTMRDYGDAMHGHSENNRYAAMGQSGESAATRSRVPLPVPLPSAGGNRPQLVDATQDPHAQLAARRSAEQQAREVMGEYRDATQARVSALPAIPPVPKVVLDTGTDAPPPQTKSQSPSRRGVDGPVAPGGGTSSSYGSSGGTSTHGTVPGGQHVSAPPVPVQGTDPSSVATPPGSGAPVVSGGPGGSWSSGQGGPSGPGGYGTPGWGGSGGADGYPGAGGYGRSGGSNGSSGDGGSGAGRSGAPGESGGAGRGAQPGARSGAGLAATEEAAMGRRGAGRAGGAGMGGMLGGGPSAEGDEDSEHTNKYGLPSDEHFDEDDDYLRDPRNREFFVAPDVIGGPE